MRFVLRVRAVGLRRPARGSGWSMASRKAAAAVAAGLVEGGQDHPDADEQVAAVAALEARHPLAGEADDPARLRPGRGS